MRYGRPFTNLMLCCVCAAGALKPSHLKAYQVSNIIVSIAIWLLQVAVVLLLMVLMVWLALSTAVATVIDQGTSNITRSVVPTDSASATAGDAAALLLAKYRQLLISPPICVIGSEWLSEISHALTPLLADSLSMTSVHGYNSLTGSSLAYQPFCPAAGCLNLGSTAVLASLGSSCICGAAKIMRIRNTADNVGRMCVQALVGGLFMLSALVCMSVSLSAHYALAAADKETAKADIKQQVKQYENGYTADSGDCVDPFAAVAADGNFQHTRPVDAAQLGNCEMA